MSTPPVMYVQEWVASYGDEGEGRKVVAVHADKDVAESHARNDKPPKGYSKNGGYDLHEVPLVTS